jgi:hypothetical protein
MFNRPIVPEHLVAYPTRKKSEIFLHICVVMDCDHKLRGFRLGDGKPISLSANAVKTRCVIIGKGADLARFKAEAALPDEDDDVEAAIPDADEEEDDDDDC